MRTAAASSSDFGRLEKHSSSCIRESRSASDSAAKDQRASIGKGVMDKVWRGKFFTLPFLYGRG